MAAVVVVVVATTGGAVADRTGASGGEDGGVLAARRGIVVVVGAAAATVAVAVATAAAAVGDGLKKEKTVGDKSRRENLYTSPPSPAQMASAPPLAGESRGTQPALSCYLSTTTRRNIYRKHDRSIGTFGR